MTVTVKLQLLVLPLQSVATQLTGVVVPGAKRLPEGGLHTTVTLLPQQGLLAVGAQYTGTLVQAVTTMLLGQAMTSEHGLVAVVILKAMLSARPWGSVIGAQSPG